MPKRERTGDWSPVWAAIAQAAAELRARRKAAAVAATETIEAQDVKDH